ncbi:MAG: tyrosine-type recombinase/integrase [Acutalibacteraceae bacterium]
MPKKSNQKRADGRIAVQVYLGTVNGKRKYKVVYGRTQKEADEKAAELRAKLKKGMTISSGQDSFEAWAKFFLCSKSMKVSDNQLDLIKSRLKFWIDELGALKIDTIRPIDIEAPLKKLADHNPHTGKPTAKKTLKSYMQILTSVFDFAIDNRIIDFNPATRVEPPKTVQPKQRRALTVEEQRRVIEFEHRGKPAMMLLMLSGLRRGEATALTWNDIDFDKKTISVTKSYDFKQREIKPPKNGKSRIVYVPELLIDYLKTVPHTSVFVLTTQHGTMMTESAWKRLLESYLCDMNLKYGAFTSPQKKFAPQKTPFVIQPFTLHCLRHTFCSMMYNSGVDVLTAQQQMGHSDVKTTLEIYTHLDQEKKSADISKLNSSINEMQVRCKSKTS